MREARDKLARRELRPLGRTEPGRRDGGREQHAQLAAPQSCLPYGDDDASEHGARRPRTGALVTGRKSLGVLMWVALLITPACEDDTTAVSSKPKPATAAPATAAAVAPAPALAPVAPSAVWSYSPVGKRDPFRSYLAEAERAGEGRETKKREATEEFELDQYRLTGLITGTAQPTAMVEDPAGRGHNLRIGSRLGKNGGRVTRITSLGIIVTEEFRAPTGERVRVPIKILLPKPELELTLEP